VEASDAFNAYFMTEFDNLKSKAISAEQFVTRLVTPLAHPMPDMSQLWWRYSFISDNTSRRPLSDVALAVAAVVAMGCVAIGGMIMLHPRPEILSTCYSRIALHSPRPLSRGNRDVLSMRNTDEKTLDCRTTACTRIEL
jgi:hypothetical protein